MCGGYSKLNYFYVVCKSNGGRRGTVHDIELEQNEAAGKQIDTVNINFFCFHGICSVIIAKLKTSFSPNSEIIQYKK